MACNCASPFPIGIDTGNAHARNRGFEGSARRSLARAAISRASSVEVRASIRSTCISLRSVGVGLPYRAMRAMNAPVVTGWQGLGRSIRAVRYGGIQGERPRPGSLASVRFRWFVEASCAQAIGQCSDVVRCRSTLRPPPSTAGSCTVASRRSASSVPRRRCRIREKGP